MHNETAGLDQWAFVFYVSDYYNINIYGVNITDKNYLVAPGKKYLKYIFKNKQLLINCFFYDIDTTC